MKISVITLLLFLISLKDSAQSPVNRAPLNDFKFQSIFGTYKNSKEDSYCLLGTGFFRAPRSKNSDSLISAWMIKHPNATVIPVCATGPTMLDSPNSRMIYCWVTDEKDTVNNYLIRNGCFPGGTMRRPKTFSEMSSKELKLFKIDKNAHDVIVYIDNVTYEKFITQIRTAEEYARKEKLGVWNERHDK